MVECKHSQKSDKETQKVEDLKGDNTEYRTDTSYTAYDIHTHTHKHSYYTHIPIQHTHTHSYYTISQLKLNTLYPQTE